MKHLVLLLVFLCAPAFAFTPGKCDVTLLAVTDGNRAVLQTDCDPALPKVQWFNGSTPITVSTAIKLPRWNPMYAVTTPLAPGGHRLSASGGTAASAGGRAVIIFIAK